MSIGAILFLAGLMVIVGGGVIAVYWAFFE